MESYCYAGRIETQVGCHWYSIQTTEKEITLQKVTLSHVGVKNAAFKPGASSVCCPIVL
jgi:hypothetical protein